MRRALVLTTDTARHPLRQRIAPTGWATDLPEPIPDEAVRAQNAVRKGPSREDIGFFLTSFVSFFIIIYGMIV
jgi:hypothetical protein